MQLYKKKEGYSDIFDKFIGL